ncbi:MAG: GYD domain-containing protein [Bryobacteraceae bacterium]
MKEWLPPYWWLSLSHRHDADNLESLYFCFGEHDVVLIADLPDNETASAISMAVCASGIVRLSRC